jgi:hypothetical protein
MKLQLGTTFGRFHAQLELPPQPSLKVKPLASALGLSFNSQTNHKAHIICPEKTHSQSHRHTPAHSSSLPIPPSPRSSFSINPD